MMDAPALRPPAQHRLPPDAAPFTMESAAAAAGILTSTSTPTKPADRQAPASAAAAAVDPAPTAAAAVHSNSSSSSSRGGYIPLLHSQPSIVGRMLMPQVGHCSVSNIECM
jgi:hypothetical protein